MKKNNKKGFFLSETMIVIAIVAVVLLIVFKIFSSLYSRYRETEKYNTYSAINALAITKKYLEQTGEMDVEVLLDSDFYTILTYNPLYDTPYFTQLKNIYNIDDVYLIDLDLVHMDNNIKSFNVQLRKFLNTMSNSSGVILVVNVNGNEFASTKLNIFDSISLIGDSLDDYALYLSVGDEFVEPGYTGFEGDELVISCAPETIEGCEVLENNVTLDTSEAKTYYLYYSFDGYILRRKVVVE